MLTYLGVKGNLNFVCQDSPKLKVAIVSGLKNLSIEAQEDSFLIGKGGVKIALNKGESIDFESLSDFSGGENMRGLVIKESSDESELRWFKETLLGDLNALILKEEKAFMIPHLREEKEVFKKRVFLLVLMVKDLREEKIAKEELFTLGLTAREIELLSPERRKISVRWGRYSLETLNEVVLDSSSGLFKMNVPVGRGFHWEHREDLYFKGPLEVLSLLNGVTVVQEIPLEEYLSSVIVSEMPSEAPLEALKAQAVAARGTALLNSLTHHPGAPYDLCSKDHCQVYKGQSYVTELSKKAIRETRGEVLFFKDELVDSRFSTVCGGITEEFYNVWGGDRKEYLRSQPDIIEGLGGYHQIRTEEDAREFIDKLPNVACNPSFGSKIDYLDYAHKLFRWEKTYKREELEKIIIKKTGTDIGTLLDIIPKRRGPSGRILTLVLNGTKGDLRLLSELEIRRALSPSHLPSSNFYIEAEKESGIPKNFKIKGAGWGHGVGMCQVGAIHRALLGKSYRDILKFYYPGAYIKKMY